MKGIYDSVTGKLVYLIGAIVMGVSLGFVGYWIGIDNLAPMGGRLRCHAVHHAAGKPGKETEGAGAGSLTARSQ